MRTFRRRDAIAAGLPAGQTAETILYASGSLSRVQYLRYNSSSNPEAHTTIHRGDAIRFTGVVPAVDDHVVLFEGHTPAGQPKTFAHPQGWRPVSSLTTSDSGHYRSGLLRHERTTYYIVRFPSSLPLNWPGYTSVIRVNVG